MLGAQHIFPAHGRELRSVFGLVLKHTPDWWLFKSMTQPFIHSSVPCNLRAALWKALARCNIFARSFQMKCGRICWALGFQYACSGFGISVFAASSKQLVLNTNFEAAGCLT